MNKIYEVYKQTRIVSEKKDQKYDISVLQKSLNISNLIGHNRQTLGSLCEENIEGIVAHKHLIFDFKEENSFPMIEGKDIKRYNLRNPSNYIVWNKNNSTFGRSDYHWKHEPCIYGWLDGASHKWCGDRKHRDAIFTCKITC